MQGFNRYYPPDYDPADRSHKGNLNKLAGKAAPKSVVRFEMPFNVWCLHCDSHIAQGVRFNAQKKRTGNYLTSLIFSFTMKCHLCTGTIVIGTNPRETCYDVLEGAKKKAEEWNKKDNDGSDFRAERVGASEDPIYKLEQDATQRLNVKDANSHIHAVMELKQRQWSDPFAQSQRLRRNFRQEKKRLRAIQDSKQKVTDRHGLALDLLDSRTDDVIQARSIEYAPRPRRQSLGRPGLNSMDSMASFSPTESSTREKKQTSCRSVDDTFAIVPKSAGLVDYDSD